MTFQWWLLLVVLALVLFGLFLRGLAGRLDRMNLRVEASWEALDAQLVRRSQAVSELAASGLLDPASAVLLAEAAHGSAVATSRAEREAAESGLSQDVRVVLDEAGVGEELLASQELAARLTGLRVSWDRAVLARRFHNEAVRMCRELRTRPLVRAFHLYGHSVAPVTFEIDDAPAQTLTRLGPMTT